MADENAWTAGGDTGIEITFNRFPFYHFRPSTRLEGLPAKEKTSYAVLATKGKLVTISKRYEMATLAQIDGKSRFEATGKGEFLFNTELGVPAALDFTVRLTVREKNKTEEVPVMVSYRLLDEAERAKIAKAAEEARKERPLTSKEIEQARADLASGDQPRVAKAATLLAEKKPQAPNPQVAKSLETVMLTSSDVLAKTNAA